MTYYLCMSFFLCTFATEFTKTGFSETGIKDMRIFYEAWVSYINRQPIVADLIDTEESLAPTA